MGPQLDPLPVTPRLLPESGTLRRGNLEQGKRQWSCREEKPNREQKERRTETGALQRQPKGYMLRPTSGSTGTPDSPGNRISMSARAVFPRPIHRPSTGWRT